MMAKELVFFVIGTVLLSTDASINLQPSGRSCVSRAYNLLQCQWYGCAWVRSSYHYTCKEYEKCTDNTCLASNTDTQDSCEAAGCCWKDYACFSRGVCTHAPCADAEARDCQACVDAGCCWTGGVCTQLLLLVGDGVDEPQSETGSSSTETDSSSSSTGTTTGADDSSTDSSSTSYSSTTGHSRTSTGSLSSSGTTTGASQSSTHSTSSSDHARNKGCPELWRRYNGVCYHVNHDVAYSKSRAQDVCDDYGASLVSIGDYYEQRFVAGLLLPYRFYWIGAESIAGVWRWENGDPVTYTNWDIASGSPAGIGSCVYMDDSGKWFDTICRPLPILFVCKKEAEDDSVSTTGSQDSSTSSSSSSGTTTGYSATSTRSASSSSHSHFY